MSVKYSRVEMLGAINLYCQENGFRISYLEKLRKSQLEAIIIKYNMNMNELLIELAKQRDIEKAFIEESKTKVEQGMTNIKDKITMLMSLLTDEQKEKFFEYCDSQKPN